MDVNGYLYAQVALSLKEGATCTHCMGGHVSSFLVQTFWRREKSTVPARSQTGHTPAYSPVITPMTLRWLGTCVLTVGEHKGRRHEDAGNVKERQ
jgi:hypothetical protein